MVVVYLEKRMRGAKLFDFKPIGSYAHGFEVRVVKFNAWCAHLEVRPLKEEQGQRQIVCLTPAEARELAECLTMATDGLLETYEGEDGANLYDPTN